MITGLNKSKILKEHISGKCKCKSDGKRCNSNQMQNKNKCQFVKKTRAGVLVHVLGKMATI